MQRKSEAAEELGRSSSPSISPQPIASIDSPAESGSHCLDVEESFFSSHSLNPVELEVTLEPPAPMAQGARRAMFATVGLLALGAVLFSLTLLYTRVIMPVPETTGHFGPVMPEPSAYRTSSPNPSAAGATAAISTTTVHKETAPKRTIEAPIHQSASLVSAPLPVTKISLTKISLTKISPSGMPANALAAATTPTKTIAEIAAPKSAAKSKRQAHRASRRPSRVKPQAPAAVSDRLKRAMNLLNAGKFASAERLARRATRSQPRRAEAWLVLGAARDAQGKTKSAAAAYRKCGVRAQGGAARACRTLANGRF